jgi:hypothetical protein
VESLLNVAHLAAPRVWVPKNDPKRQGAEYIGLPWSMATNLGDEGNGDIPDLKPIMSFQSHPAWSLI